MFSSAVSLFAENLKDEKPTKEKVNWWCTVVLGLVFIILGIIGNIFSIAVWSRRRMRSSTGIYLIAQSVASLVLLCVFFSMDCLQTVYPAIKTFHAYGVYLSYFGYPFFFLSIICSIWFTVGVTVDRYIGFCVERYAKDMCSTKRAATGIGIITVLCFVINIPHFMTYTPVTNKTSDEIAFNFSDFGQGQGSQMYEFWVHCMFLVLVPWITIAILNTLIIRRVISTGKQVFAAKSDDARLKQMKYERQLTITLLAVTFTFLILIAFQCIVQCFAMLQPSSVDLDAVDEGYSFAKLGVIINASINFLLYCVSGHRFRKELCNMLNCSGVCGNSGFTRLRTTTTSSSSVNSTSDEC